MDGLLTLAFNRPSSGIDVFLQTPGTGLLSNGTAVPSYDGPEPVQTADLDLDGRTDIVTLHGGWGQAGVYYQQPDGQLSAEVLYPIPATDHFDFQGLAVADISGDGLPDIIFSDMSYDALVVLYQLP